MDSLIPIPPVVPAPVTPVVPVKPGFSLKTWAVKIVVLVLPIVVAITRPGSAFNGADAGTVLTAVGVLGFAAVHSVEIALDDLRKYGLDKAGLEHVARAERANYTKVSAGLSTSVHELVTSVDAIKGAPQVIEGLTSDLRKLITDVERILPKAATTASLAADYKAAHPAYVEGPNTSTFVEAPAEEPTQALPQTETH